jgi:hypothetical protein
MRDITFLLVGDRDSYTERFLALLPCTYVLQSTLVHLYHYFWSPYHTGLCCVFFFQFLVHYSFFFFLQDGGQYVQRAMLVYPRDSCGNTACCLFAHMLVCIAQTGLEPASGSMEVLPFSQCNVEWRRFVWSGVLGCPSFASS